MRAAVLLVGAVTIAFALGGCSKAASREECLKVAKAQFAQDQQRVMARIDEIKASRGSDFNKDRQALMDLMVEAEGAENRHKIAIGKCNA